MMSAKTIYIASDHAGFALKEHFLKKDSHYPWVDLGSFKEGVSVDYTDFAKKLAESLKPSVLSSSPQDSEMSFGVLICKSGQGMCMQANRYPYIRAALGWSVETARLSREHNNANVLCLGSHFTETSLCEKILKCFLETHFLKQHHQRRVEKLSQSIFS